jgi:hypothetical protein
MSEAIIRLFWQAVSDLARTGIPAAVVDGTPVQRERAVGRAVAHAMHRRRPGNVSFYVIHEDWDPSSLATPTRPPQPDIGIALLSTGTAIWPIEFKLMPGDAAVAEYTKEYQGNFLTCRYAADTAEGALIACLEAGRPAIALSNIAKALGLMLVPGVSHRPTKRYHKMSVASRHVPAGKPYNATIRCHHIVLQF